MWCIVKKKKKKRKKKKLNETDVDSLVPQQQYHQQLGNAILMIFIKQKVILVFAIDQYLPLYFCPQILEQIFVEKFCKATVVY